MGKILKSMAVKVVVDPEPPVLVETEFVENLKSEPEVVVELVSLKEEISSRPTEVEELPIETLVDLLAEPTKKFVPFLTALRVSLFFRSPDMYDSLHIFLMETVSQEFDTLIYGLDLSGVEL